MQKQTWIGYQLKFYAFLLAVAFTSEIAVAQGISYLVTNDFRYGIGEQFQNDDPFTKEYLENLLNGRVFLNGGNKGSLVIGFRAQIDRPREFGPDTVGLTQYFAEYSKDGLTARGGTYTNLINQGLVFNTFESRPIGFNTQAEGVIIDFQNKKFDGSVFGGTIGYADILDPSRFEEYLVRGTSGEIRPVKEIAIGSSFLSATGEKSRNGFRDDFDSYTREAYVDVNVKGKYALHLNWADKRTVLDSITRSFTSSGLYGTALYGKAAYSGYPVSITTEYKNYRFDLVDPIDRDVPTRETRALPFQNGPTLVPEHDKTLLARNPHTIDFSDEVGFQVSGLVYPSESTTISVLATAASRHSAYNPVVITDTLGIESLRHDRVDNARLSIPELTDSRYSPYWEVFLHGEHILNDDITLAAAVQRKSNVVYYDRLSVEIESATAETQRTTTGLLEGTINLKKGKSLHTIVELQHVYDSKKVTGGNDSLQLSPFDGRFQNVMLTLEFSQSPRWSANARIEYSTYDKEQGGTQVWPVLGGTYRIGTSSTVGAQYGLERGGVVCTGGVCRFINPFTGLRLFVTSRI